MTPSAELAKFIDHTLLKPEAVASDFEKLCQEAIANQFFSVCVPPSRVSLCAKILRGTQVKVCTVIGFPLGYSTGFVKAYETKTAVELGAHEVDMVINISALKSGEKNIVLEDIRSVVQAASGRPVKVILETCLLTDEEKKLACELSLQAGAHFVKTSTGFSTHGATLEDVHLMVAAVGEKLGVKASGGIKDFDTAKKFIDAGATRLGTSSGIQIISGKIAKADKGTY